VRCQRVVFATGERREWRGVYCPPEERTVELSRCESCVHCFGLGRDDGGVPRHVTCDSAASSAYPDAGPVWRAPGGYSFDAWLADHTPVGSILEGTSLCVLDDLSMEALAELLMASNRSGVPVVDEEGRAVGIVTRTDVVRTLRDVGFSWEAAWTEPHQQKEEEHGVSEKGLPRTLVGETMTPMVFSVTESAPVSQAAALLAFEGVRQLVVTAQDGRVVGLVRVLDITSWMARLSGYALGAGTQNGGNGLEADGSRSSQAEGAGVAPSAAVVPLDAERPPSGTVSVLLVDPDEAVLREAVELGRAQLLHVLPASNEADAVSVARNTWIDGAIISLSNGNGDSAHFLVRLLRSLPGLADLPVVLLGQQRDLVDRFAAARVRASMFLDKPLNADLLAQTARHLAMVRRAPPARILLVETGLGLSWVADCLQRSGMHVARLNTPNRILDMLDTERPDMIVTSSALGDVSAMDLCRVIRAHPPWQELTTVVLQAGDHPCLRSQCFEAGCDDYLEPPLDAHELLTRLRARLTRAQVLRERADYDGLTGLLTRRGFDETLEMRLADARRYNQPLALGLIDLDDLKAINDCHGHLVGDRVLRALGSVLGNHFRSGDLRARVGGDEFVVALAGESPASAIVVLNRALEEFCGVEFDSGSGVQFGASFTAGVAAAPEDGTSREALLRAADRRLYSAKRTGKCQISASQ